LWQNQIEGLSDTANTLALDLPGHGASRGPGYASVEDYAAVVAGLLQSLQPPRPIACGLSIGGAIVLQLLIDRPALLAGGVLIGTGARLRVLPAIIETIETRYGAFIDMLGRLGASAKTDPGRLTPVLRAAAACTPAVAAGDFRACDRFDVMDRLACIDKPVLVISAADDQLTPPKYSDYLEARIAGSRRVHIPDAGHLVPVEQPAALNQALQAFVTHLPEDV
jgi:pimeloyl-ACP methyl ester carboxylesterase